MTNAELLATIRAEIERRLKNTRDYMNGAGMKYKGPKYHASRGRESAYDAILSFLYTLESEKTISPWKKIHTYTEELHEGDMEKMLLELSVGKGEKRTKVALPDRIVDILESEKPMNQDELKKEIETQLAIFPYTKVSPELPESRFIIIQKELVLFARHFAQWGAEHLANSNDEVVINGHKVAYNKDKDAITMEGIPKDLEEAAEAFAFKSLDEVILYGCTLSGRRACFIAGAKWQKEQMMEEARNHFVLRVLSDNTTKKMIEIYNDEVDCEFGDVVRVIVLPKED